MKKLLSIALLALALAIPAKAQTNVPPSTKLSDLIQVAKEIGAATNWMASGYGIYDATSHKGGVGVAAIYNVTPLVGTFVRFDYINKSFSRVSGGAQIQYAVKFMNGKMTVIPFVFAAPSVAMGGAGAANGDVLLITGYGGAIRIGSKWDAIGDYENWNGHTQIRFGALYKF